MPFQQSGSIKYFTFDNLANSALTHAVFTRQGGVSSTPWDSLNMGGYIGDPLENTYLNRVRAFEALERDPASVYDVWQIHSADVICAAAPRPKDMKHKKADAILTNNPNITLFMRFADCVPVLFFDPVHHQRPSVNPVFLILHLCDRRPVRFQQTDTGIVLHR